MRQILRQKICRVTYAGGRATESLCSAKTFSHTINQLLHQYHKILALRSIKGELLEYWTQPIFWGINVITDNYHCLMIDKNFLVRKFLNFKLSYPKAIDFSIWLLMSLFVISILSSRINWRSMYSQIYMKAEDASFYHFKISQNFAVH